MNTLVYSVLVWGFFVGRVSPNLYLSIYDSLNLPFSVAARQIFVTDKFGFLCTLAQCEWNRKAREVCR